MRVLVVEDDKNLAFLTCKALEDAGMKPEWAGSAEAATEMSQKAEFKVIVLDIHLPGITGIDLLKTLRDANTAVSVLLISAKGDVDNRISGLNAGADDFLPKPFNITELVARVKALERREAGRTPQVLKVGDLSLNRITRQIFREKHSIELTAREFRLLEYLMNSPGKVCSREEILQNVWDYSFDPGTNVVDVCVRRLRDKIDRPGQPAILQSVRGVGYVLQENASGRTS